MNASTESAHTTLSGSWFQWTIVSTKNECLDCYVIQSGTLRPFEFFTKHLSIIFVVSQSLLVMGIGNIFKIDDRYINIDRSSVTIAC